MDPDWRCISYSRWGHSIGMLVYQRVMNPWGTTDSRGSCNFWFCMVKCHNINDERDNTSPLQAFLFYGWGLKVTNSVLADSIFAWQFFIIVIVPIELNMLVSSPTSTGNNFHLAILRTWPKIGVVRRWLTFNGCNGDLQLGDRIHWITWQSETGCFSWFQRILFMLLLSKVRGIGDEATPRKPNGSSGRSSLDREKNPSKKTRWHRERAGLE